MMQEKTKGEIAGILVARIDGGHRYGESLAWEELEIVDISEERRIMLVRGDPDLAASVIADLPTDRIERSDSKLEEDVHIYEIR